MLFVVLLEYNVFNLLFTKAPVSGSYTPVFAVKLTLRIGKYWLKPLIFLPSVYWVKPAVKLYVLPTNITVSLLTKVIKTQL